jgi:hypothetical protein
MSGKPLLISDCDEVLMHMVVPFRDWLTEAHHIHFELEGEDFSYALTHKHDGTQVEAGRVWELLHGFFDSEMHRQYPIDGAVQAIGRIQAIADVVILTNLQDHRAIARGEQLKAVGIDAPVFTNQGGKGDALARIVAQYQPSVTLFIDDLYNHHQSVAETLPEVWRLHMVGEPLLARKIKPAPAAHARIDQWAEAEGWVRDKLLSGEPAPIIEGVSA